MWLASGNLSLSCEAREWCYRQGLQKGRGWEEAQWTKQLFSSPLSIFDDINGNRGLCVSCSCSDVCSTCGSCPGTDSLCPSQPIRLSFCPRTQRASVIYHQFSISRHTHEKRNVHLADIKSEEPVPIQTRTLETHLVTQICISLSLSNNALLGLFLLSLIMLTLVTQHPAAVQHTATYTSLTINLHIITNEYIHCHLHPC